MSLEVLDDGMHVGGVPEGDHVDHEPECAEFFFLPFPVTRGELTASTVTHPPGEAVAVFLPIELDEDASALLGIIDVVEHMDRLGVARAAAAVRTSGVGCATAMAPAPPRPTWRVTVNRRRRGWAIQRELFHLWSEIVRPR